MICPFCKAENAASTLTPDAGSISTCIASSPGHYDEAGKWVCGVDPNWHTQGYSCSRGHRYTVTRHGGDEDVVKLVSTLTWTDPGSTSVVLAVDPSRSTPDKAS